MAPPRTTRIGAIGHHRKNEDLVTLRHKNLVIGGVDFQRVCANQLRFGSLDHADRSFLSVGPAAEGEDRLRKRVIDVELVASFVVADIMHCPAEFGCLSEDPPPWSVASLRQPGEGRNLRMGHSVRYQEFVPFGVVGDGARVPDLEGGCTVGCGSDCADRRRVPLGRAGINRRAMIAHVGHH